MNRRWMNLLLFFVGTLILFIIIISLPDNVPNPEDVTTNGMGIFLVGVLIGSSTGEMPGGKGTIRIINSLMYWMVPGAYLLAVLIVFMSIDALFYLFGVMVAKVIYPRIIGQKSQNKSL